jgi:DNA gyrase subunit A
MNTAGERIIPTDLRNEMSRSYLEYAMSVIVGRALPDARDGLKPVHRRILYAMHELGLTADRPFRKCARVVGEVLGKYHPHGDTAVYDALVRMAQDFSMRAPLIAGHGNFGSIDNDPPAAMRYTECRLQQLTSDALLRDIDAETVDFIDNFDGSQQEPMVLPARVPQLLLNGAAGIAVGMATNIPPHNLGELADGLVAFIRNPEISDEQLRRIIPGPDFPTGGKILGISGIRDAYTTGKGSIIMRGVADIETIGGSGRSDRDAIVITELPYQTNKAALIEKIADLVNDKQLEGIADIRDESDREGLRIVIELKRDANPRVVLNNLYKHTPLQTNFGCNMLALVDGDPQLLNLRQYLEVFLEFRVETITRRTRYELRKAEERDLILQGLLVALEHLDAVIALIRHAESPAAARQELVNNYGLTETQADAILQMQLRRLTALETEKIQQEHEQLQAKIADLQDILARRERILGLVESEIEEIKAKHNTPRRTVIEKEEGELDDIDLIANEQSIVLLTEQGYIKRMPLNTFGTQSRATRGKSATNLKDSDSIAHFFNCRDHDGILFFSERGIVYSLRAYQIPMGSRAARGVPLVQMLPISRDEKITSVIPVSDFTEDDYLVMLTKGGNIKRTALSAFKNIRTNGLIAISLEEEDQLRWVRRARTDDSILIGSRLGMAIHFQINSEQLRPRGRVTRGVKAMNLQPDDELVGMDIFPSSVIAGFLNADGDSSDEADALEVEAAETAPEETVSETDEEAPYVLAITQQGYGKRIAGSQFRLQRRAGKGTIATKFRKANDRLAALRIVKSADELMLITHRGIIIRYSAGEIPTQSKQATGVRVQRLDEDDFIVAVTPVPPMEMEAETDAEESPS